MVRKIWDVYTHSASVRLPRFWLEAFEAAYEYLSNDVPGVRDTAMSEIAKLSMRSLNLDSLSAQSKVSLIFLFYLILIYLSHSLETD